MALTVSLNRPNVAGDRKVVSGTITFDNPYATGGQSLTAANLGLSSVEVFIPESVALNATPVGVIPKYNYTTSKVLAFQADGSAAGLASVAEVTNGTDLSAYSFRFVAFGK